MLGLVGHTLWYGTTAPGNIRVKQLLALIDSEVTVGITIEGDFGQSYPKINGTGPLSFSMLKMVKNRQKSTSKTQNLVIFIANFEYFLDKTYEVESESVPKKFQVDPITLCSVFGRTVWPNCPQK